MLRESHAAGLVACELAVLLPLMVLDLFNQGMHSIQLDGFHPAERSTNAVSVQVSSGTPRQDFVCVRAKSRDYQNGITRNVKRVFQDRRISTSAPIQDNQSSK